MNKEYAHKIDCALEHAGVPKEVWMGTDSREDRILWALARLGGYEEERKRRRDADFPPIATRDWDTPTDSTPLDDFKAIRDRYVSGTLASRQESIENAFKYLGLDKVAPSVSNECGCEIRQYVPAGTGRVTVHICEVHRRLLFLPSEIEICPDLTPAPGVRR